MNFVFILLIIIASLTLKQTKQNTWKD